MKQVIQSLVNKDGSRVEMPAFFQGAQGWGNLAHPDVYEADAQQMYPEGTRYVEGDRIFRYNKYIGKATASAWIYSSIGATDLSVCMGRFLFNSGFPVTYTGTYTYGVIDTNIIEIDTLTLTIEKADNFYSGGYFTGYSATNGFFTRRIVAHDYSAAKTVGGNAKTLVGTMTVDQNLVSTFSSLTSSISPNPFKRTTWNSDDADALYGHTVGASMVNNTTVNYWMWTQTRGPMGCAHIAAAFGGAEERETMYSLHADGSIDPSYDQVSQQSTGYPIIGFIMHNAITETGSGQDDSYPILWLNGCGID